MLRFVGCTGRRNETMHTRTLLNDIADLKSSGPRILGQGRHAPLTALRRIITLHTRIATSVVAALEAQEPEPFFAMLAADRACARHAATLLYLPDEGAIAAAKAGGGELNGLAWSGISRWGMVVAAVPGWTRQLEAVVGHRLHRAAVTQAAEDLRVVMGRDFVNEALVGAFGEWRAVLKEPARGRIAARAASMSDPGSYPGFAARYTSEHSRGARR